jgi:hypothetical protein
MTKFATLLLAACSTMQTYKTSETTAPPTDPVEPPLVGTTGTSAGNTYPATLPTLTTPYGTTPSGSAPVDTAAPIRFVALGDAGLGNDAQFAVADAIGTVCAQRGCDFAVYLGDNFYDAGADSVTDPLFQERFEDPYADLDFPFYISNGNHDLDQGDADWKADIYVDYAAYSEKWTMPARYYTARWGDLELFALDTTPLDSGDQTQAEWLDAALAKSTAPWKVVFGHHPYRSNGDHGNAGSELDAVFTDVVCGRADMYLCGHDHDLEWLEPVCGMELIVSGAGSQTRGLGGSDEPAFYTTDQTEGFVWLELDGDQLTGTIYDRDAVELYSMTVDRSVQ